MNMRGGGKERKTRRERVETRGRGEREKQKGDTVGQGGMYELLARAVVAGSILPVVGLLSFRAGRHIRTDRRTALKQDEMLFFCVVYPQQGTRRFNRTYVDSFQACSFTTGKLTEKA